MQSLPRELTPKLIGRYIADSDQVLASVMDYRSQRLQEHCTFSPPYRLIDLLSVTSSKGLLRALSVQGSYGFFQVFGFRC